LQEGLRTIGNTEALKKIVGPREGISIRRQCGIMDLNRGALYYQSVDEDPEDLDIMRKMGSMVIYPQRNLSKLGFAK